MKTENKIWIHTDSISMLEGVKHALRCNNEPL